MKKFLVTGALGQIGTELVKRLRQDYGQDNVIASNRSVDTESPVVYKGLFEELDVTDKNRFEEIIKTQEIDTIIHLAGILSATGEQNPLNAWNINMNGLLNTLELARKYDCSVFTASSIAAFGPDTPADQTPQVTIQRPTTMYGITKVAGELLCDYYFEKYGVDTRSVRFPGIISYDTLPGGGTTDYAVHIYYDALEKGEYASFIAKDTYMDMMYMPDAIDCIIDLMNAPSENLNNRNAYNVSAMSIDPENLAKSIQKYLPSFKLNYDVDPSRQAIAESWPNSLDCSAAKAEWHFNPTYNLDKMTVDMLEKLSKKLDVGFEPV